MFIIIKKTHQKKKKKKLIKDCMKKKMKTLGPFGNYF